MGGACSDVGVSTSGNACAFELGACGKRDRRSISSVTADGHWLPPEVAAFETRFALDRRELFWCAPVSGELTIPISDVKASSASGLAGGCLPNVKGKEDAAAGSGFFGTVVRGGYVPSMVCSCG